MKIFRSGNHYYPYYNTKPEYDLICDWSNTNEFNISIIYEYIKDYSNELERESIEFNKLVYKNSMIETIDDNFFDGLQFKEIHIYNASQLQKISSRAIESQSNLKLLQINGKTKQDANELFRDSLKNCSIKTITIKATQIHYLEENVFSAFLLKDKKNKVRLENNINIDFAHCGMYWIIKNKGKFRPHLDFYQKTLSNNYKHLKESDRKEYMYELKEFKDFWYKTVPDFHSCPKFGQQDINSSLLELPDQYTDLYMNNISTGTQSINDYHYDHNYNDNDNYSDYRN